MQKFDVNTLESQYIQSLLYDTWVPTVPVFSHVPDKAEIEQLKLKASQTIVTPNNTYVINENKELEFVDHYVFGKFYPNITSNYHSRESYYSTSMHEALGRYLRFVRDLTDLDLLPLYNCYSNKYLHNQQLSLITVEGKNLVTINQSTDTDIILIPVQNNKKYQLSFDARGAVVYYTTFLYDGESFLQDSHSNTLTRIDTSFSAPVTVDIAVEGLTWEQQRYLHLAIQVPTDLTSSIVVVERFGKFDVFQNLQLTARNRHYQFAYSDKLFSYLLGHVIVPNYEFQTSIEELQDKLCSESFLTKFGSKVGAKNREEVLKNYPNWITGTFTTGEGSLQHFIYNAFRNEELLYNDTHMYEPIRDFAGYIDADVEHLININGTLKKTNEISTVGY